MKRADETWKDTAEQQLAIVKKKAKQQPPLDRESVRTHAKSLELSAVAPATRWKCTECRRSELELDAGRCESDDSPVRPAEDIGDIPSNELPDELVDAFVEV